MNKTETAILFLGILISLAPIFWSFFHPVELHFPAEWLMAPGIVGAILAGILRIVRIYRFKA